MRIDELIIDGEMNALSAMRRLEETGRRILFIAPGGRLEAVLTDSDIRKNILRGGDLSCPAAKIANHSPKSLPMERRSEAKAFLQSHSIDAVPLLDKSGIIVDVVFLNDLGSLSARKLLDLPVVIMAGGLGTRLYPYTKILPKPLIPVGDIPVIEHVIRSFTTFGCDDFTLLVNHKKNMIKSYFSDIETPYTLHWAEEDVPLGTGGGLYLIKGQMKRPFFLTNCDTLLDADYADVLRVHESANSDITMICAMKRFTIPYGVVDLSGGGAFEKISEKPCMNFLTNTGVYLVGPQVLAEIKDGVPQGFTDIIADCKARGGRVSIYPVSEESWMDMGRLEELESMRRRLEKA